MRAALLLLFLASSATACGGAGQGNGDAAPPPTDAHHDAGPPPNEDTGTPGFDTGTGCSAGAAWAKMDRQPIVLADPTNHGHRMVAGLDLDGAGGAGISIPEVEGILCTGSPFGHGPSGTVLEAWGNSDEVQLAYDPKTLIVQGASLFPDYLGTMTLPTDPAGPDAGHTFTVGLGQVLRDGAPFTLDWTQLAFTAGNQLYNAIAYNAAGYTGYYAASCRELGECPDNTSTGVRQWQLLGINVVITFNLGGTAANESTVVEIDLLP